MSHVCIKHLEINGFQKQWFKKAKRKKVFYAVKHSLVYRAELGGV